MWGDNMQQGLTVMVPPPPMQGFYPKEVPTQFTPAYNSGPKNSGAFQ